MMKHPCGSDRQLQTLRGYFRAPHIKGCTLCGCIASGIDGNVGLLYLYCWVCWSIVFGIDGNVGLLCFVLKGM